MTDDEADFRQVRADIWYPAVPATDATAAPYCADFEQIKSHSGLAQAILPLLRTHAFVDPPPDKSQAPYPTILLSPGNDTNATDYVAFTEELVSHGFVVVTIDHSFQSRAVAYPDGRVVKNKPLGVKNPTPDAFEAYYRSRVEARVADMSFVLDELQKLNADQSQPLAGMLDLNRVGAMGHSMGGIAAAQICYTDNRIKAAANLDGRVKSLPFFPDTTREFQQPLLDLSKGPRIATAAELAQMKLSRGKFNELLKKDAQILDETMRSLKSPSYRVTITCINHDSFSDTGLWMPGSYEDRHRKVQVIRNYLRAFFDNPVPKNPDAKVERFGP